MSNTPRTRNGPPTDDEFNARFEPGFERRRVAWAGVAEVKAICGEMDMTAPDPMDARCDLPPGHDGDEHHFTSAD